MRWKNKQCKSPNRLVTIYAAFPPALKGLTLSPILLLLLLYFCFTIILCDPYEVYGNRTVRQVHETEDKKNPAPCNPKIAEDTIKPIKKPLNIDKSYALITARPCGLIKDMFCAKTRHLLHPCWSMLVVAPCYEAAAHHRYKTKSQERRSQSQMTLAAMLGTPWTRFKRFHYFGMVQI